MLGRSPPASASLPPPPATLLDVFALAVEQAARHVDATYVPAPATPDGLEARLAMLERLARLHREQVALEDERTAARSTRRMTGTMQWTGYAMFVALFALAMITFLTHPDSTAAVVASTALCSSAFGLVIWIWRTVLRPDGP
jgi:hypothetical protein